ncbi:hypothetical protein ETAA8_48930 [Anatilimnocola aggregata]|uniref:Porin n=1 Tax=Anatilimnocola aggregata TaxID=2528021 RepID=A0A517YHT2_9BACT|nr:Lpg1974 family pore-forming outer membrane protein [Anatilimnocola aggregata]QDU29778.1 hypothetical protein ETAA8_48930 [Anatilimnocola aggregata]
MKTNGVVGAIISCVLGIAMAQLPAQEVPSRELADGTYTYDTLPAGTFPASPVTEFYAGTEFFFASAQARTGGRITVSFSDTTAPGVATLAFADGDGHVDFGVAPRVWIGRHLNEAWGIRATYFSFSDSEEKVPEINPAIPAVGTNFSTNYQVTQLDMRALDLDLIYSAYINDNWKLDTFVGARYSSVDIDALHHSFGVFTTGNFVNLLLANGSAFDGAGTSLGFSSRHRLNGSNLSFIWSGRGSHLWGHYDAFNRAAGTVASSPSAPLVGAETQRIDNAPGTLDIIETQLGLQYEFQVVELPINCFFRTSFEFQRWNMAGPAPTPTGFGGTIGELTTNSNAAGGPGGATLVGLSLATGFTW